MSGTIFSLIPPIVAIALALITKEVYLSLLIGIMSGAFLFTGPNPLHAVETMIAIMGEKIGGNVNILLFLAFLGIVVALITKSGASKAYGEWASHAIRTKKGALFATMFLGMLIFVDDYFNCLTVGTVMRPVTDKHKITRAKLAYIIDATAAPICIIAPISSWAAAVGSSLPEDSGVDGFSLFLHTIPFNLYALLTICFMLFLVAGDFDFAAMKRYEEQVKKTGKETTVEAEAMEISGNGKVIDLILPILVLIAFCVSGMLYTGGILDGVGLVEAFANCDSALSLVLGSFFTLVFIFVFYMIRRVIRFNEFCRILHDRRQGDDPGDHDSVPCLDSVWYLQCGLLKHRRLCQSGSGRQCAGRLPDAGPDVRHRGGAGVLDRYVLRYLRYSASDCICGGWR